MSELWIRNGRLIDPSSGTDRRGDLLVRNGLIAPEGAVPVTDCPVIDAVGLIVSPGWIDCRVALREPGFEEDETIESGTSAAVAGGFTTIASLPDTQPVVETRAAAEFVARQAERAGHCNVLPLGAVTKGTEGQELAEIGQLVAGGAVGFTDGKRPLANAEVMRRALQYCSMWSKPILHHPQVPELVTGGVMNEGFHSAVLGLRGMPTAAEEIMVRRDIALAELTGGRIHLTGISSRRSVDELREARNRGIAVSADVTPAHLLLTDEAMTSYGANYKLDPPLRTQTHIEALIAGLKDGTIEIISSDHTPVAAEKKARELDVVPFGIIGLETALSACRAALIEPGYLTWGELLSKFTIGPARLYGLITKGTLQAGADADLTIFDPDVAWTVDASRFRSKSGNTPFHGQTMRGRVRYTIVDGLVRYQDE
ncbi:dihydroorotase [Planctomyces sp. SH-PL14]|uniref:dihydroorotase n=1 Tax=Planctomyces sp. SH-PL14 TaxID=1632864 RepID=UPI0009464588|nr:dihydroorotase [Planctomyces sp. SH-PL14]